MAELDVYFKLEDDVFVWNSEKAAENRRKHGIRFEKACEVFFDREVLFVDASTPEEESHGGDWLHGFRRDVVCGAYRTAGWRDSDYLGAVC